MKLYALTHISYGAYAPEKFEVETARNLETVVKAIQGAVA